MSQPALGLGGNACPQRPLLDDIRTALEGLSVKAFVPTAPGFPTLGKGPDAAARQEAGQCRQGPYRQPGGSWSLRVV